MKDRENFVDSHCIPTSPPSVPGACPQDDLVWPQLTASNHLYFYGRLKGLKGKELKAAVTKTLELVSTSFVLFLSSLCLFFFKKLFWKRSNIYIER